MDTSVQISGYIRENGQFWNTESFVDHSNGYLCKPSL